MKNRKESAPKLKKVVRGGLNLKGVEVVFSNIEYTSINHLQTLGRANREPQPRPAVYIIDYSQKLNL